MSLSQLASTAYEPCAALKIPAHVDAGYFAFANIKGDVNLVQGTHLGVTGFSTYVKLLRRILVSNATPASALTTVDVKIFRHEFITIFRFSEATTLHPADICILEPIEDSMTRYEEEEGTVFLAKELMDHLRRHTDPRFTLMRHSRYPQYCQRRRRR